MNIKVGKYNITDVDNQYVVTETKVVRGGKTVGTEKAANHTYHPTIESALTNVLRRKVHESDATTLEQLRRDVHDAVAWLKGQFQPIAPVSIGRYSFDAAWDEAHGDAA